MLSFSLLLSATTINKSATKSSTFLDIMLCSLLKVNQCFRGTCCLHLHDQKISQARNQLCLPSDFMLVSYLAYSLTLKMEATSSSEMWADFQQQTTWRYIPEDKTLHNHCCENLESYKTAAICY
jgi:hypothetical protein